MSERWDDLFDALANQQRRRLLLALAIQPPHEWVELPDAAMSEQYEGTEDDLRVELVHRHLPTLTEPGYVRWRSDPLEAGRGPTFDQVQSIIDSVMDSADRLPEELVDDCRSLSGQTNGK